MFANNPTNGSLIIRAADWHAAGHGVAFAFVIQTWGSSPRPVGSVMIIRDDMLVEGSVSGGCVEGAVIEAGGEAIRTGVGRRLDFGVATRPHGKLACLVVVRLLCWFRRLDLP